MIIIYIQFLAGCGTDLYGRFIKCSQCRNYDCEDEGRCLLKKGKCFAKEKPTPPTKWALLPTGDHSIIQWKRLNLIFTVDYPLISRVLEAHSSNFYKLLSYSFEISY